MRKSAACYFFWDFEMFFEIFKDAVFSEKAVKVNEVSLIVCIEDGDEFTSHEFKAVDFCSGLKKYFESFWDRGSLPWPLGSVLRLGRLIPPRSRSFNRQLWGPQDGPYGRPPSPWMSPPAGQAEFWAGILPNVSCLVVCIKPLTHGKRPPSYFKI